MRGGAAGGGRAEALAPLESEAGAARPRRHARAMAASRLRSAQAAGTLIVLFNVAVLARGTFAGRAYALAFLLLVPGTLAVAVTPLRPRETAARLAWSVGASMLLLMLLGLLASVALPPLGIAHPLGPAPLLVAVDVTTLALLVPSTRRGDPLHLLVTRPPRPRELGVAAGLAAFVLLAVWGAELLDDTGSGALATAVLSTIGLGAVALLVGATRLPRWVVSAALYSLTAGSLLMASMRSNVTFGYDIQSEYRVFSATMAAQVWHVPAHGNAYGSMLSITVLPATLHSLTQVSGTYLFKLAYPLVFSLFPVLVLVLASRLFPLRPALFGALVLVVQGFYAADITGLARQEIGLVFFALFALTAFDRSLSRRVRQGGAVVAAAGMSVSHYSTAYFAAIVTVVGFLVFALARLLSRRAPRPRAVFSLPVVALVLGSIALWNVGITHSAGNVTNAVSSLGENGLGLLSGPPGSSLLTRFLNADVGTPMSPSQFATSATAYYARHAPYLHPFPDSLTRHYPVRRATVPATTRPVPASVPHALDTAATVVDELLLLLLTVGALGLAWHERRLRRPVRSELAAFAIGCLVLLGLLRLSSTLSTLYNAPRGQVQGAPLLTVGLAFICTWIATRRRLLARASRWAATVAVGLLVTWDSGLAAFALGGSPPATLANYGEEYQASYFTDADMASALWLVRQERPGDVTYADTYGALQILHFAKPSGLVTTVLPQVLEPGAFVFATSTNVVEGTDRSTAGDAGALVRFPLSFLDAVDNLVFTTGTTRVYR